MSYIIQLVKNKPEDKQFFRYGYKDSDANTIVKNINSWINMRPGLVSRNMPPPPTDFDIANSNIIIESFEFRSNVFAELFQSQTASNPDWQLRLSYESNNSITTTWQVVENT